MNKKILTLTAIIVVITGMVACKSKKKDAETSKTSEQTATGKDEAKPSSAANEPTTFQISAMPDTVLLGKEKEAMVQILGGEAVALQNPDGKSTGMNIKFNLRATNKSTLEHKKFFNISYNDARLELDHGTNTTAKNGDSLNPDAEASLDGKWEFEIPAGTKPTKLNLFYDGTRVSVAITLK